MHKISESQKTEYLFQNPFLRSGMALFCCFLWGSAFPCVKIGYEWLSIEDAGSQVLFAGYRFFLAGIFTFFAGCILERRRMIPEKSSAAVIVRQAVLQTTLQYIFFYIGMAHTTGIKGSVINASNAFISILAAHFLLKGEKITWKKSAGCLIGFAGVITINLEPGAWGSGFSLLGEGMIFLCSAVYGVSSVTLKMISHRETPVCITAWQLLIGSSILIAAGLLLGGSVRGFHVPSVLLLLYMALLSTAAFSLWSVLLKYRPVGEIAVFGFSIPVFGSLLSAAILGEQLISVKNLIALVLVAAGILIVNGGFSRGEDSVKRPI